MKQGKYVLYCHSGSANHGCEALVRTIAAALQPENVVVLSDAPEEDRKYGVGELVASLPSRRGKPGLGNWLAAYLKLKLTGDYHYMDAIPYFPALDIIEKDDVAISIGGDVYCYDQYPQYWYINREIRKRAGKMILLGCSIEPELLSDPRLREDLQRFDLITARESITFGAVWQVNEHTVLLPDSAFGLPVRQLPLPEGWQAQGMVGVNVSPLVLRKARDETVVYDAFRKLVRFVLEQTDMGVALIPHVVWENNDDREPLNALYQEFRDTGRVVMVEDHNCTELKGYISRCRFFVGARTHATIAAYSTGVPTLVVGYSVKARGIARDLFGSEEGYVLPVENIQASQDIVNAFRFIMARESDVQEVLTRYHPASISELQI